MATTIHCFRHEVLAPALRRLRPVDAQGEHSLTGMSAVLHDAGYRVESVLIGDPMEAAGVNDRAQLAVAEAELRDRINERWMRRGVTMWDPERTYVDAGVQLEPDVVLLPGVVLQGACVLGAGAEIGPDCHLVDTVVGEGAVVARQRVPPPRSATTPGSVPSVVLDPGPRACRGSGRPPHRGRGPGRHRRPGRPTSAGRRRHHGRRGSVGAWSWFPADAWSSCPEDHTRRWPRRSPPTSGWS